MRAGSELEVPPENLALVRKLTRHLLKLETTLRWGIKTGRLKPEGLKKEI
jgi:hypothetical protein